MVSRQKKQPIFKAFRKTLRNKPMLALVSLVVLLTVSGGLVTGFGVFLLTYYVYAGDQGSASVLSGTGATLAGILGVAIIPAVTAAVRRFDKERTLWFLLIFKALLAIAVWFCYNPDFPWLALIPPLVSTPLLSALWVVLPSMLPDVVDYDELQTGERREGTFSAVFSWSVKASFTVNAALSGPLLVMSGFDIGLGADQQEGTLFNMRLMMVAVPLVGLIICAFLLKYYPINREVVEDIRKKLEARRGAITNES